MNRILQAAAFGIVLGLCTGCAGIREAGQPMLTVGSAVRLHTALVVPERRWSVYLQDGKPQRLATVDESRGYCELNVHGPKPTPQHIAPGVFIVTSARRRLDRTAAREIRIASIGALADTGFERRYRAYESEMSLSGADDIRAFTCTVLQEAGLGRYMTLAEARSVVGDVLSLQPASAVGVEQ